MHDFLLLWISFRTNFNFIGLCYFAYLWTYERFLIWNKDPISPTDAAGVWLILEMAIFFFNVFFLFQVKSFYSLFYVTVGCSCLSFLYLQEVYLTLFLQLDWLKISFFVLFLFYVLPLAVYVWVILFQNLFLVIDDVCFFFLKFKLEMLLNGKRL